jgi:hypothetical protein
VNEIAAKINDKIVKTNLARRRSCCFAILPPQKTSRRKRYNGAKKKKFNSIDQHENIDNMDVACNEESSHYHNNPTIQNFYFAHSVLLDPIQSNQVVWLEEESLTVKFVNRESISATVRGVLGKSDIELVRMRAYDGPSTAGGGVGVEDRMIGMESGTGPAGAEEVDQVRIGNGVEAGVTGGCEGIGTAFARKVFLNAMISTVVTDASNTPIASNSLLNYPRNLEESNVNFQFDDNHKEYHFSHRRVTKLTLPPRRTVNGVHVNSNRICCECRSLYCGVEYS